MTTTQPKPPSGGTNSTIGGGDGEGGGRGVCGGEGVEVEGTAGPGGDRNV